MADNRIYPKANTTAQWYETHFTDGTPVSRATFSRVDKFLLHTTETTGWPGYKGGRSAPTITYHPRLRQFRQHNFINRSARALMDPDSTPVKENRDNVAQIEIICYTDLIKADSVGGLKVTELTDVHLQDIADLYKWLNREWNCPIYCNLEFPPYRPYKNVRLTSSQFDAYRGLLGHMHASGNTHTDPGNINAKRIIQLASAAPVVTAPIVEAIDAIEKELAAMDIEHPTLRTVDDKPVFWAAAKALWSMWYYILENRSRLERIEQSLHLIKQKLEIED